MLLVVSADHLFQLDLCPVVQTHFEADADVTIVTTLLPRKFDASRYLLVDVDGDRVRGVDYKPDDPGGRRCVSTEVFAYRPSALAGTLADLEAEGGDLGDYGERLLPRFVDAGTVAAVAHDGHWRDLGTPLAYLDTQLELLRDRPPMRLDDPGWPVLTSMPVRAPAAVHRTAELDRAWLSPGADVAGSVVDAIIGPGVTIERGADVRHSVLMGDVVVRSGARVARSVLAENVVVGKGAQIGTPNATQPVLVGTHRRIAAGATVDAGTHMEPHKPRGILRSSK